MKIFWTILVIYLVIMNIAAMSMTIIDKQRAIRNRHYNRISERALFFTALFGGAPLMYLTMLSIRHKTKHYASNNLYRMGVYHHSIIIKATSALLIQTAKSSTI